ncbi:MAG: heme-binding domain-containing protein [Actinobacteria bacterium]|nr:heme-binding domain-containing protein [Actinomycetota bacterium]MBV9322760.1 heme-binding domain-containing protein [Chloroflexota bacterium]MBV9664188.1 heme-binding domain-containing protein [Actinomycetota bacterium]
MKKLMFIPLGLAVAFAVMQPFAGHISDPPGRTEPTWDSPRTKALAVAACFDCHSNQTKSRWYEHVAPVSWWIQGHVSDGRRRLNFDAWDPAHHRSGTDIARTVTQGSMPPTYYTWFGLHAAAHLTAAQRAELAAGLQKTIGPAVGVRERLGRGGGD